MLSIKFESSSKSGIHACMLVWKLAWEPNWLSLNLLHDLRFFLKLMMIYQLVNFLFSYSGGGGGVCVWILNPHCHQWSLSEST